MYISLIIIQKNEYLNTLWKFVIINVKMYVTAINYGGITDARRACILQFDL